MLSALLLAAAAASAVLAAPAVTLTANATSVRHLDWLSVSASGLTPNANYFMAVYYPANASTAPRTAMAYPATAPWTVNAPAEYVDIVAPASGAASFTFRVIAALVPDMKVAIFSGTSGANMPTVLASTPAIPFADADAPIWGHLMRLSDLTSMRVVWASTHNDDNPTVMWGTAQGGPYTQTAFAESFTYAADDLCGEPATTLGWAYPGYHHYATIHNLVLGSTQPIYYVYGSAAHGYSAENSFVAPPAPGPDSTTRILLVADMGVSTYDQPATDHWAEPDASETIGHLRDWAFSGTGYDWPLVAHVGDVSYATGMELKWHLYETVISTVISRAAYIVGLGNHERDFPGTSTHYDTSTDSGGECGIATQVRYPNPALGGALDKDMEWFSIQHGAATFIMLGSEVEIGPGSSQYVWLAATLAAVNRSVTPWVIVAFHRPMYMVDDSAAGGSADSNFLAIEPLIYKYEVDLVLVGHVHNAYASCPVYNQTCVTTAKPSGYMAPVHVSIGNAGQGISPINPVTKPSWVDFQMAQWGYSTFEATATDAVINLYQNSNNGTGLQTLVHTVNLHREPSI